MITKITNGSRPGDLAAYLHGPGRANEHEYERRPGGAVIGGTLGREGDRDGRGWAMDLREAAGRRPDIAKPIWHMSVRAAPGDRMLTDGEWADVAHEMGSRMGWADKPYVVVRHGADHVHIVVSRVGDDGAVWNRRDDRYNARRAANAVEQRLGLAVTPERTSEKTARRADHQLTQGEHRRAAHDGAVPPRVMLAERVRAARDAATGRGREGFEAALDAAGVQYRANVAKTGTVSGYSFALPGHTDGSGEQVWWKASQIDKTLSWRQLEPVLQAPRPVPVVDVPKKLLETKARHAERVTAAQQAADEAAARAAVQQVPARIRAADQTSAAWWVTRQRQDQQHARGVLERQVREAESWLSAMKARATSRAGISQGLDQGNRRDPRMNPALADALEAAKKRHASEQARTRRPHENDPYYRPNDGPRRGPSLGR